MWLRGTIPRRRQAAWRERVQPIVEHLKTEGLTVYLGDDGDFGASTEAAVKAVQAHFGLAQDGVVGPATWSALIG